MRILMVGPPGIALERPLGWVLAAGHHVWLVSTKNPYAGKAAPPHYRYFTFVAAQAKRDQKQGKWPNTKAEDRLIAWMGSVQLRVLATWFRPHLIHTHAIGFEAFCCAQAQLRPLVVSAWGFLNRWLDPNQDNQRFEPWIRAVLESTDVLIVENPNQVAIAQALLRPTPQIELMPLGVNTRRFRPGVARNAVRWRQGLEIPPEATMILSPRAWSEIYGHHHILEAFALAYPHLPQPAVLVFLMLGRGFRSKVQEQLDAVRQRAEELELADAVIWKRDLPYTLMPTMYTLADVAINYPTMDCFPSTMLEAMACECPIITAALPAYEGTVFDTFCTSVPPNQPTALAQALIAFFSQPVVERTQHLAAARQAVVQAYDTEITSQRLRAIYDGLRPA